MRARSMVGHSVSSVPVIVSPTHPRTFVSACATRRRPCQVSSQPQARVTPKLAPTTRQTAAAT